MMELSFSRPLVHWNIRSRERMVEGTFVPWNIRSEERISLGTFVHWTTLGNFLFLYHKRKYAVQNGPIIFLRKHTIKHPVRIIDLDKISLDTLHADVR